MYFATMTQICYAINKGSFSWDILNQRCVAFVCHVLKGTKAFVTLEYLRLGLFIPPIYMAKHMCHVKKITYVSCEKDYGSKWNVVKILVFMGASHLECD
jgi:hypothetical protein